MKLQKRNNTYHLRKRVPVRYKAVEPRASFYVSLNTDSKTLPALAFTIAELPIDEMA